MEDTSNIPSIGRYIYLETRLINGILICRPGYMGNRTSINLVSKARRPSCLFTSEQNKMAFTRLSEDELAEFLTKTEQKEINKNTHNILLDGCYLFFGKYMPEKFVFIS